MQNFMRIYILTIGMCMAVNAPNEKIIDIYAPRISRCIGSPELLYRFCCIIPPFFTQDTARKCGSRSEPVVFGKNITGLVRYLYDCSYWYCSLNIYELLTPKGFVDIDKYFVHLDLWANLNTAFRDHIIDAKVQCKQSHRYYLPLKPCEFFNMNQCIRNYLKVKCPVPIQTKECIVQKKFFDECGDYFI